MRRTTTASTIRCAPAPWTLLLLLGLGTALLAGAAAAQGGAGEDDGIFVVLRLLDADPDPNADYDGDGLSNGEEQALGTSIHNPDSDLDGLLDGEEVDGGTNPLDADSDDDGIGDGEEGDHGTNPLEADTDGDGVLDGQELADGTDPLDADTDDDGLGDLPDRCPLWASADNTDTDGDGVGDVCQCGDVDLDGYVQASDVALLQAGTASLPLAALLLCDVDGDGLCTEGDATQLDAIVSAQAPNQGRCASYQLLHGRVLERLGHGHDAWSLQRIQTLGLSAYVAEQMQPATIPDPDFDAQLESYSAVGDPLYYTVGADIQNLRRRFCPVSHGCAERVDELTRVRLNQREIKILRAIYTRRQLASILTDFWYNHFNVFANSGDARWAHPQLEATISANMFGPFEELLTAVAKEPAMMEYLDLRRNTAAGPNENYAREVMELHTVGLVDTYDEDDIAPAAQLLTGNRYVRLTVAEAAAPTPKPGAFDFEFIPGNHDGGVKTVSLLSVPPGGPDTVWSFGDPDPAENTPCGSIVPTAGENEMLTFLCLLARHPKTAELVSGKLITRFLGDELPQADRDLAQDAMVAEWLASDGDLSAVLQVLFDSDQFLKSLLIVDDKAKRPLAYAASLIRALGPGVEGPSRIVGLDLASAGGGGNASDGSFGGIVGDLEVAGEDPYWAGPPTGYPETSASWTGVGVLLLHLEQSDRFVDGLPSSYWDDMSGLSTEEIVDTLVARFIPSGMIAQADRTAIVDFASAASGAASFQARHVAKALFASPRFISH